MHQEFPVELDLPLLRRYVLILLAEGRGVEADVLRARVQAAGTRLELQRLRAAIFECMALHLGEAEAMDRLRSFDLSL